ncbi:IS1 family transposase [Escherichia coli]
MASVSISCPSCSATDGVRTLCPK